MLASRTLGPQRGKPWRRVMVVFAAVALVATACGDDVVDAELTEVRLGFFANVTHAPAIIGSNEGYFAEELGDLDLRVMTFNAGNEAITALFSGALDMTFIGPNPAINGYAQSQGHAIRIVAGTTSGGASLVVHSGIDDVEDLRGTRLATPALANTQDVALRAWLDDHGLMTDHEGGGDVSVAPQANAQILQTFLLGQIDGAWVPEPWASRLVLEGGGHVLVDERDLWPDGRFVTTHLIVRTEFLDQHPEVVAAVVRALVRVIDDIAADPVWARELVNDGIAAITGSELSAVTLERAWEQLTFTVDPIASSLRKSADDAIRVGLLQPVNLDRIYRLELLNTVLRQLGREEVLG